MNDLQNITVQIEWENVVPPKDHFEIEQSAHALNPDTNDGHTLGGSLRIALVKPLPAPHRARFTMEGHTTDWLVFERVGDGTIFEFKSKIAKDPSKPRFTLFCI